MRFIDLVIGFLIIKKIHLPHWHHSRLDFQKIDWKQIKIKVMNCLDSRENSPCRYISYLYLIKTQGATHWQDGTEYSNRQYGNKRWDQRNIRGCNTIQYNTQSLGYYMNQQWSWWYVLVSQLLLFLIESLNDKYTVTVSLDS